MIAAGVVLGWIWRSPPRGPPRPAGYRAQWKVPRHSDYVFFGDHAISLTTRNIVHGQLLVELALVAMLVLLLAWKRRYGLAGAIMAGPMVLIALPGPMAVLNAVAGANQMHRMWAIVPWPFTLAFALAVAVASRRRWVILGVSAVLLLAAAAEHANIVKLERQAVLVPVGGDRRRPDRDRGVVLGAGHAGRVRARRRAPAGGRR